MLTRLRLFLLAEHVHLIFSLFGFSFILAGYRKMTARSIGPSNNSTGGQGVRGTGPRINAAFLSDALGAGGAKVGPATDSTAGEGVKHVEAADEKLQMVGEETEPSEESIGGDFTDVDLGDDETKLVRKV
jgi:hypothetical protein